MDELKEQSKVQIKSYKHDGSIHRIWKRNTILSVENDLVIGVNDQTVVIENDGQTWVTKEPAIFYFSKKWWFNVISLLQGNNIYYYCNLSSPFIFDEQAIKYIDYDLDIMVYADLTYVVLDHDEYYKNKRRLNYPRNLTNILKDAKEELIYLINHKKGPFAERQAKYWYDKYLNSNINNIDDKEEL